MEFELAWHAAHAALAAEFESSSVSLRSVGELSASDGFAAKNSLKTKAPLLGLSSCSGATAADGLNAVIARLEVDPGSVPVFLALPADPAFIRRVVAVSQAYREAATPLGLRVLRSSTDRVTPVRLR